MSSEVFVWYRCDPADAARVRVAASQLQAHLADSLSIRGRLLQRDAEGVTFMEHYPASPALLARLQSLGAWWPDALPARHTELFSCLGE